MREEMLVRRHTYSGHASSTEAVARPSAPCKNLFEHKKIGSSSRTVISPNLNRRPITATTKPNLGGTLLVSLPCFSLLEKKF